MCDRVMVLAPHLALASCQVLAKMDSLPQVYVAFVHMVPMGSPTTDP